MTTQMKHGKISLSLVANRCYGISETECDLKDFLLNDVASPSDCERYGINLYAIGNEFGCVCCIWARNDGDALDIACDLGKLESFQVDEDEAGKFGEDDFDRFTPLGNAGELHNIERLWIQEVNLDTLESNTWFEIGKLSGEGCETLEG